ncbi:MAG: ATP-binding response regulator, partial [Candidatus Binatia bacterium]
GKVGAVSPEHKEYLGDILASGRHLLELINDVLDLAKVESGNIQFNFEPVELTPLVQQVCQILQSLAAGRHQSLDLKIADEVEHVVIDSAKFKQILYNYVSNAIKFTDEGGRISIRALAEDRGFFRIEVEDTGIGIAPEKIAELFGEFKQLEPGLSKRHQGTGLGLALTKKFIEAQGGRVGVRSVVGQGSVFFAILPRGAASAVHESPRELPHQLSMPLGPLILVVEDDENDLNWLERTLSSAGYVVDTAANGAEAIAKARHTPYAAVLLDLILPDTLGWDVLHEIRQAKANENAPVIVATVVTEKTAAKNFALQDYLTKPFSASMLLTSLRRAGVIGNGSGKQVLVVDADPQTLQLAGAALDSSGYQTSCYSNAQSALQQAADSDSDIAAVVFDLSLADMDGHEFLDRLRKLAACKDTPVIVWTAKNITTDEREKLNRSANSITFKSQGGIDALLRELRYHVRQPGDARFTEQP